MSPRRYGGWEPATVYHYDDAGRITHTTTEPEWDTLDQALIDELLNWQAGVHKCGHHETENTNRDLVHVASFTVCKACQALQRAQDQQAQLDKPAIKAGRNPDYARRWVVQAMSRAQAAADAAARALRKDGAELLAEAHKRAKQGPAA